MLRKDKALRRWDGEGVGGDDSPKRPLVDMLGDGH